MKLFRNQRAAWIAVLHSGRETGSLLLDVARCAGLKQSLHRYSESQKTLDLTWGLTGEFKQLYSPPIDEGASKAPATDFKHY